MVFVSEIVGYLLACCSQTDMFSFKDVQTKFQRSIFLIFQKNRELFMVENQDLRSIPIAAIQPIATHRAD